MKLMKFAEILTRRRELLGYTKADVARKLKISSVNVTNWEAGKHGIDRTNLVELAKYLGLTTSQLNGEAHIPSGLLFKNEALAEAAGYKWEDPQKNQAPEPYESIDQEPGRFLLRVNLEDIELLSVFHQLDVRARRDLLDEAYDLARISK